MRYEALEAELNHAQGAVNRLIEGARRVWKIRPHESAKNEGLTVVVRMSAGRHVVVVEAHEDVDPYNYSLGLDEMSADDLELLSACRRVVDDWITGEIDDLPTETPSSVLMMRDALTLQRNARESRE